MRDTAFAYMVRPSNTTGLYTRTTTTRKVSAHFYAWFVLIPNYTTLDYRASACSFELTIVPLLRYYTFTSPALPLSQCVCKCRRYTPAFTLYVCRPCILLSRFDQTVFITSIRLQFYACRFDWILFSVWCFHPPPFRVVRFVFAAFRHR